MSHDLDLAQQHAWSLARTLMVPVTLFRIDGEFGVMVSSEYDAGDDHVLFEYDPWGAAR